MHTDLPAFKVAAVIAYAGLLGTWLLVASGPRGSLRGNLLQTPPSAGPVRARKGPGALATAWHRPCQNRGVQIGMTLPVMEPTSTRTS